LSLNREHILSVSASTKHLSKVRDFVGNYARNFGFRDDEIEDIRLAVDEAFTNVVKHAYQNDSSKKVKIKLGANGNEFWISITDFGKSYDPSTYREPDLQESIKEKKRGGVGVYLIKKLMDKVEYRTSGPSNEILMKKKTLS